MSLDLLKAKTSREGYLTKSAAAKGKDQVRNSWKERYFILKGHMLHYYVKQGDNTPKGEIDMRLAKIDPADNRTHKSFSFRLAQTKQVFTYFVCHSLDDQRGWIRALRKAASYPPEEWEMDSSAKMLIRQPRDKQATRCCFPALLVKEGPEQAVLICQDDGYINLAQEGEIVASHAAMSLTALTYSDTPDVSLVMVDGVRQLHTLETKFSDPTNGNITGYKFYIGSLAEAQDIAATMRAMMEGTFSSQTQSSYPVVQSSRLLVGPMSQIEVSTAKDWADRFAVLTADKFILYKTTDAAVPLWCFFLRKANVTKEGTVGLCLQPSTVTRNIRFANDTLRNLWYDHMIELIQVQNSREVAPQPKEVEEKEVAGVSILSSRDEIPGPPLEAVEFLPQTVQPFDPSDESYVIAWGQGDAGQLGQRNKDDSLSFQLVKALEKKKIRFIAAGSRHACAINDKGHLFVWGAGDDFQLGLGKAMKQSLAPYLVTSLLSKGKISMVSCGAKHTLALTELGQLFAWGSNDFGQLGTETPSECYPVEVPAMMGVQCKHISAGTSHSGAIAGDDNKVYLWGEASCGALGTGNKQQQNKPKHIEFREGAKSLACGNNFTAVILKSGKLYTFGNNKNGQLGHGDTESRYMPTEVVAFKKGLIQVLQVTCGDAHMVAIVSTGRERHGYTWGKGITNGFQDDQSNPAPVPALKDCAMVSANTHHTLTVNSHLQCLAFGLNQKGELGNGKPGVQAIIKVRLQKDVKVVQAACGSCFSMVLCKGDTPAKFTEMDEKEVDANFRAFQSFVDTKLEGMTPALDSSNEAVANLLASLSLAPEKQRADPNATSFQQLGGGLLDKLAQMDVRNAGGGVPVREPVRRPAPAPAGGPTCPVAGCGNPCFNGTSKCIMHQAIAEPEPVSKPLDQARLMAMVAQSQAQAASASDMPPPPPPPDDDPDWLPENWKKVVDPNTQKAYYYNKVTRETSWKKPK